MELMALILMLSAVMWYVIDRVKPYWAEVSYGKYITMGVAAAFGFALSFGYGLDIVYALGLVPEVGVIGQILTGLILMSGASAVSEIIAKVKG
jgi:hypothetical protein